MTDDDRSRDEHGFVDDDGSDETMMNRRNFLKAAVGAGAAGLAVNGVPKRPAGEGFLGAGIADELGDMREQDAPVEEAVEWSIRHGDHPRSQLRPGYLNTTPLFDLDTLDVDVEEGEGTYDVNIDVDLKFVEGSYEEAVEAVHEDPDFSDEVEVRNLQGNPVKDDIFAYHNEFDHEGGNYWTTDKTGISVADSPETLEEFIGDTPAEFMATFAYAVMEEGEVGKGHPYSNHGSALIDTIDTDHWEEQYEGLDPGSYDVKFNLKPGEGGSGEETESLNYTGDIEDVTNQFRSNTHRFTESVRETINDYF